MNPTKPEDGTLILPELLAPAGNWDCARAAVENGADAIYFGVEKFNARLRGQNFTTEDLPLLIKRLHERGVRGYLAFNTLVFESEMEEARELLEAATRAGVDGVLLQDVGICQLAREISPDLPLHASTQMSVTSARGVRQARELGCRLAVVARELHLSEIARLRKDLAETGDEMPLETFVHGALCVAYSGQCLTSEALGGRSANRGVCAQACRMPYDLLKDGKPVPLGDRKYLLSPRDLAGLSLLPQIVASGVSTIKIEGRLKTPQYVASITRLYRQALDRLAAHPETPWQVKADEQYTMEMAFSRGLHTGWLQETDNRALVHADYPKKRGVFLGTVEQVRSTGVAVHLASHIRPGDGVVFDRGRPEEREEGGRVWSVCEDNGRTILSFERGKLRLQDIAIGDKVWKTSDPELEKEARQSWEGDRVRFHRPVEARIKGALGQKLSLEFVDAQGNTGRAESFLELQEARKRPLTPEFLREQLGRLGETPFVLGSLQADIPDNVILPMSELNELRRRAVDDLLRKRSAPRPWTLRTESVTPPPMPERPSPEVPQLSVLVRSLVQLEEAARLGIGRVYLELENPKQVPDAVHRFRDHSCGEIFVAGPRIHKPGEDYILRPLEKARPDGYLTRNVDQLEFFKEHRRIGDFSFNIANARAARWMLEQHGLEFLTASYDLNIRQLLDLLAAAPASWFEVVLHQHMPMFHMEHCLFCAFLTSGKDFRDCGRPCEKHEVRIQDHTGAAHPVKADAGCRNTVFNARAQTGADFCQEMLQSGLRRFRLEFLDETPTQMRSLVGSYQDLLRGERSGEELWKEFKLENQLGVTRGTLRV